MIIVYLAAAWYLLPKVLSFVVQGFQCLSIVLGFLGDNSADRNKKSATTLNDVKGL